MRNLGHNSIWLCDEWGGAESRGNGARPVEWMIMNDTCATHRSRVPRRSFGRNKRRSDDIGRRERTRPGFYFMFCVWQSSVRGCRFSVMFVYLVIKMFKCSPVPASFFPYLLSSLHWPSLVFQCRHSSFYSFRSSSVGLETGEWRRCRSLSFTPPASLRSHGSRPRPTRHRLLVLLLW